MDELFPENVDELFPENVSYIQSRDPSIQNFTRSNLRNVRVKMKFSVNVTRDPLESVFEEDNNCSEHDTMQVYLRVKPSTNSDDYVIHENELLYKAIGRKIKGKEPVYKRVVFSKIFGTTSTQVQVFDDIVKIKVLEFLNGKATSLFVYGAPGAGKTFTSLGTAEEPGFIPRTLEYLFKTLPKLPEMASVKPTPDGRVFTLDPDQKRLEIILKAKILGCQKSKNMEVYQSMQDKLRNEPFASLEQLPEVSLGVWVSFVEIYNEEIYDLLQSNIDRKKVRIASTNGEPYIKDLTHICVSNGLEAYLVYQYGLRKLKCSKTNIDCNSGQTHFVFTIKIAQTLASSDKTFISALNICNLAAVEGTKKMNGKDPFKESYSINNSLMVLGMCISTLQTSQKCLHEKHVIPFRDSKLTLLFKKALSCLENFCMIININSSKEASEENYSILNFSALNKQILTRETFLHYISSNQVLQSEYISALDLEIEHLEDALHETKSSYEDLKRNKSYNYDLEKRYINTCHTEIFHDLEKIFDMKKNNLEEELEEQFKMEVAQFKVGMMKKKERRNKKEVDEEVKHLKEKFKNKEKIRENLENEISELKIELNERMGKEIEKNGTDTEIDEI